MLATSTTLHACVHAVHKSICTVAVLDKRMLTALAGDPW
jgi:hypothetical protein